ncbi:MAG: hypothetical protein LBM93_02480 [Oscillospiraceae bacterium]|nr:hypothetical protein [Oscillospiraceae bacterium]
MKNRLRTELAESNQYYVQKHRYLELKYFCFQYPIWRKEYLQITALDDYSGYHSVHKSPKISSPTEETATKKLILSEKIELIEKTAKEVDDIMSTYILKGVTEDVSYDFLKLRLNIPCCRDTYYNLYRKFFWVLSRKRD